MGVKTRLLASGKTEDNEFNISLLGFKVAVNEGLTVFNLVDGVVDEFNDESGTDESEGSNDLYNAASDFYINSNAPCGTPISGACYSAGFSTTAITEPDTSTAGTNPAYTSGQAGVFTVPTNMTSINAFTWGAGGGADRPSYPNVYGGGGGFAEGTLAVTPGQSLTIVVGEGGANNGQTCGTNTGAYGGDNPGDSSVAGRRSGGGEAGGGAGDGGGLTGVFTGTLCASNDCRAMVIAGAGGGGGADGPAGGAEGGPGGGQIGDAGGSGTEQASRSPGTNGAGGGSQTAGGEGIAESTDGGKFYGGGTQSAGDGAGGGAGWFGGGGGGGSPGHQGGGGGSSYFGHPQVTSGSTEEGVFTESARGTSGGAASPHWPTISPLGGNPNGPETVGDGAASPYPGSANYVQSGDGYVLLVGSVSPVTASATSTTIVSTTFSATSVPSTSRIVVFEENIDTPTLNTDIIASVSRDGGSTYTTATLTDSGYVTGSSGQRILTGQATISGQPTGQSMRWKLALANNQVKIHGVSLQWS